MKKITMFTDDIKGILKLKNKLDILGNCDTDKDIISNFGHLLKNKRLGQSNNRYFNYQCFNYALNNYTVFYLEDSIDILNKNYIRIKNLKNIEKKDIILFYDDYEATHLAKVIKTNKTIQGTTIRAKFGNLGIYEHKLNNTPIGYGNKFCIFRKGK